ncbi:sigma factor [Streptomyces sp. NPDC059378]|uniref:sigma factor n=1 Tax=Streptomyces sp. NPDC059378 TaxID=3346815 RepID=UPI00367425AA
MLGSFHEAEDLAQETRLRPWKTRDRYAPARASTRTWPYRIATNVCLTALEGRGRRPLPSGLGAFPGQRFDVDLRTDLWLVWVTAVHCLPARQCAVLVLREVLEVSAADAMFMDRVFRMRGPGWRTRELTANGQPALAAYAPRPGGGHLLHTIQVFTVTGGRVAHNVVFADPRVLAAFGLPSGISVDTSRRER